MTEPITDTTPETETDEPVEGSLAWLRQRARHGPPPLVDRSGATPRVDTVRARAAVDALVGTSEMAEAIERQRTRLVADLLETSWWLLAGSRSPQAWLVDHTGLTADDARRLLRHARVVRELPRIGRAWFDDELPTAHLDTLARAAWGRWGEARDHQDQLLSAALQLDHAAFVDHCADWVARRRPHDAEDRYRTRTLRLRTDDRGDLHGSFYLPGDDGTRLAAAIEAATDTPDHPTDPAARSFGARRADALVDLVCGDGERTRVATTTVVVDRHLLDGRSRCDHDATAVSAHTARRLACTSRLRTVELDPTGLALRLGRAVRSFSPNQRTALAATYRRCVGPACDVAYHRCELHHLHHWEHGGPTDPENAAPLCRVHHHLVHEGGWAVERDADGAFTWHPPPDSDHDPIVVRP